MVIVANSQSQMEQYNFMEGDQGLRKSTLTRNQPVRRESRPDFLDGSKGSPPTTYFQDSQPDADEARDDFWFISGDFTCRHHVEPRVKLYTLREESFPIPLKYVDVTRVSYNFGCIAGKPHRLSLEHQWTKRFVRFMDKFRAFFLIEGETSRRIHVVRGE